MSGGSVITSDDVRAWGIGVYAGGGVGSRGAVVNLSVANWGIVNIAVVSGFNSLEGSSASFEGSSDSGIQIINWGNTDWVILNWGGQVNWGRGSLLGLFDLGSNFVVLDWGQEWELAASSDVVLEGEESVGEGSEVRSECGVKDEHVSDKVMGEWRVVLLNAGDSFGEQNFVNLAMLVVIEVFGVLESGQSKESSSQREHIRLRLVSLDFEVGIRDLSEPFGGKEGVGLLNGSKGEAIGSLLWDKGGVRELVDSVLDENVEWSDITVRVAFSLENSEGVNTVAGDEEELVLSVVSLLSFMLFEISEEVLFEDFDEDRDLVIG